MTPFLQEKSIMFPQTQADQVAQWQENLRAAKSMKRVCFFALSFFVFCASIFVPEMFKVRPWAIVIFVLLGSTTLGIFLAEHQLSKQNFSVIADEKVFACKQVLKKIRTILGVFQMMTFAMVLLVVEPIEIKVDALPKFAVMFMYYGAYFWLLAGMFMLFLERKISNDYLNT